MDYLMFPERFPGILPQQQSADHNVGLSAIHQKLAILLVDEDMTVRSCTVTFAKLYDVTPADLVGTNMFKDWGHYGIDNYRWLPKDHQHSRKSVVEILMALAKEDGASSQMVWFTSPNGNIRRVVMRCFYLGSNYLFIDLPLDDKSSTGIPTCSGIDDNGMYYITTNIDVRISAVDREVANKFMCGWDFGRIADHLSIDRSQVREALERYQQITNTADLDELREVSWEWAADEKMFDSLSVIRANGCALS
jgi:hypothetical protein